MIALKFLGFAPKKKGPQNFRRAIEPKSAGRWGSAAEPCVYWEGFLRGTCGSPRRRVRASLQWIPIMNFSALAPLFLRTFRNPAKNYTCMFAVTCKLHTHRLSKVRTFCVEEGELCEALKWIDDSIARDRRVNGRNFRTETWYGRKKSFHTAVNKWEQRNFIEVVTYDCLRSWTWLWSAMVRFNFTRILNCWWSIFEWFFGWVPRFFDWGYFGMWFQVAFL